MRMEMMTDATQTAPDQPAAQESTAAPAAARKHHIGTIAMFSLLALAALGLGGMYFKYFKTPFAIKTTQSQETVQAFLTSGQADLRGMKDTLTKTEGLVKLFGQQIDQVQVPVHELPANPFDPSLTLIAVSTPATDGQVIPASHLAQDASNAAREQQRQTRLAAARQLKLQSILFGSKQSHCLIDGKLYAVGQTVGGFTIHAIERERVHLQIGSDTFVITLGK